jgi:hypothetical protein
MNNSNDPLVDQLRGYAERHVAFDVAKDALIQSGVPEEDIVQAAENFPYDLVEHGVSIDGVSPTVNNEVAVAMGTAALDDQRLKDRDQVIVNELAAEYAPDMQSKLYYKSKVMDDLGIPWQIWLLLPIAMVAVSLWLHLPDWVIRASELGFIVYVLYKFYQRFHKRE